MSTNKNYKDWYFTSKSLIYKIVIMYLVKNFKLDSHYNNLGNKIEFINYDFSVQYANKSFVGYLGQFLILCLLN